MRAWHCLRAIRAPSSGSGSGTRSTAWSRAPPPGSRRSSPARAAQRPGAISRSAASTRRRAPNSASASRRTVVRRSARSWRRDGVPAPMLLQAGLVIAPDDGRTPYDRFRGRVIFPICDRRGRVVAFGGRALGDGQPKYLQLAGDPALRQGQPALRPASRRAGGPQGRPGDRGRGLHGRDRAAPGGHGGGGRAARHRAHRAAVGGALASRRGAGALLRRRRGGRPRRCPRRGARPAGAAAAALAPLRVAAGRAGPRHHGARSRPPGDGGNRRCRDPAVAAALGDGGRRPGAGHAGGPRASQQAAPGYGRADPRSRSQARLSRAVPQAVVAAGAGAAA